MKPKQFIIEVTNRCNLQCKYCPNVANAEHKDFPVGDMSLEFFQSIVDRIKKESPDSVVIPWMNGEPFLHPQYLEMLDYLSRAGLSYYVTTNLTIWREDVLRHLLSEGSGCYQLIISLDGIFGSGSIEKARPGTNEELICTNLDRLLRLKEEMGSQIDLAVKICERGQDWEEIEKYIQYWLKDPAIEYVCVGKPLKDENSVSMRMAPCQYFDRNFMVIRWNGTLVPCAYNNKVANKLMLTYGILNGDESLLEAYRRLDWLRELQNKGHFPDPCATCGFAYTGQGFEGVVSFRGSDIEEPIYYHQDYYNMFFSLSQKWKPSQYYLS